jgi:hypothetical protein
MKRIFFFVLIFSLFILSQGFSQIYIGAGPDIIIPVADFDNINKPSAGFNFQIENRFFCKLWYGLKIDYANINKKDGLPLNTNYYDQFVLISPQIRYNLTNCDNYHKQGFPYLQTGLTFSSVSDVIKSSKFGLGGYLGAGFNYGFTLWKICWILDFNASYSSPNFIYRAEERNSIQSINVGLNLSIGL